MQGVFFRKHTRLTATGLGLTGQVRNLPDGSVEVLAAGTDQQLDALISWCHLGPEKAAVSSVTVKECEPQEFTGFKIVH